MIVGMVEREHMLRIEGQKIPRGRIYIGAQTRVADNYKAANKKNKDGRQR